MGSAYISQLVVKKALKVKRLYIRVFEAWQLINVTVRTVYTL
jgi:hypothetical protein